MRMALSAQGRKPGIKNRQERFFIVGHLEQYQQIHKYQVNEALKAEGNQRMFAWSQDLAVGSKVYVAKIKSVSGVAAKHRAMLVDNGIQAHKESVTSYMVHFGH